MPAELNHAFAEAAQVGRAAIKQMPVEPDKPSRCGVGAACIAPDGLHSKLLRCVQKARTDVSLREVANQ